MSVTDANTVGLKEQEAIGQARVHSKASNVLEILSRDGRFSKLLKIFSSSGSLQNDLGDPRNQVTIFAPTDKAFEELDQHCNVSREELEKILEYHVISDIIDAVDITESDALATNYIAPELFNEPQRILVERKAGKLYLNYGTKVNETNIAARNGIVHVIDQVLELPKNIPEQLGRFSQFSIFLKALEKSGLEKEFNEPGLTVFIPSNFAFKSLGPAALDYLYSAEGREDLRYILLHHISPELIYAGDLKLPVDGREIRNNTLDSEPKDSREYKERLPKRDEYQATKKDNERNNTEESSSSTNAQFEEDNDVYRIDYPAWIRGKKIILRVTTDYKSSLDVTVNGQAHLILTDGIARNGVIHVIDRVLLPPDVTLPKLQWHEINE